MAKMIPISSMRAHSQYQMARSRGFDPARMAEEELSRLEEKAKKLEEQLREKIRRIREVIDDFINQVAGQIETAVPDQELEELEARIQSLEDVETKGRELLQRSKEKFQELEAQNRSLKEKIREMRNILQKSHEDHPAIGLIDEAGCRASRSAAGLDPVGPARGSSRGMRV